MRQVQGSYKGCKVGTRQVQGVQGRYKAVTRGVSQVQSSYKGCKAGTSLLQGVQGRYEVATRGER